MITPDSWRTDSIAVKKSLATTTTTIQGERQSRKKPTKADMDDAFNHINPNLRTEKIIKAKRDTSSCISRQIHTL